MILLDSTSDLIQVVTDATADIEVHASWVDNASGTITPASDNTPSITTATTTTVVASPGASTQRSVRHLNIRNNHASTACTVTVQHTDGTDTTVLFKTILGAGETIVFGENGIWVYYDAAGKPYMGLGPIATQAEMEAGTSTTVMVTPGRQHFHPSSLKCWGKATVSGGVPSLASNYNLTSITDTAAGRITFTIATDFSDANWTCTASIESTSDTMSVTNLKFVRIGLADQAAGTVILECHDLTAITSVLEDPTAWHFQGAGDHV